MKVYNILDIKGFTGALFNGVLFDDFFTVQAEITTYNSFLIDGRIKKEYYDTDEIKDTDIDIYSRWKKLKPICFNLIKGKKLPVSFALVFKFPQKDFIIRQYDKMPQLEQKADYYINIKYNNKILSCTSVCSINTFTAEFLNKGNLLQEAWDDFIKVFLKDNNIAVESELQ